MNFLSALYYMFYALVCMICLLCEGFYICGKYVFFVIRRRLSHPFSRSEASSCALPGGRR